jgi:hypothetical protein
MNALNKQSREINDQLKGLGHYASKTVLNNLQVRSRQLKEQRRDLQEAWSKRVRLEKQHRKEKEKKPKQSKAKPNYNKPPQSRNKSGSYLSYTKIKAFEEKARQIVEQIKALDSQIKSEASDGRKYYHREVLESLMSQRDFLAKQYAKIPDPLSNYLKTLKIGYHRW